ncbi:MAG: hypothetical protein OER43_18115 [Gammaproteobacteria bacterium]|nr:hypothetical protein [Gammaproteobacteria bacterium]
MTVLTRVVTQAKRVARQYYALTGRPLGITGEIAELPERTAAPVRARG